MLFVAVAIAVGFVVSGRFRFQRSVFITWLCFLRFGFHGGCASFNGRFCFLAGQQGVSGLSGDVHSIF